MDKILRNWCKGQLYLDYSQRDYCDLLTEFGMFDDWVKECEEREEKYGHITICCWPVPADVLCKELRTTVFWESINE